VAGRPGENFRVHPDALNITLPDWTAGYVARQPEAVDDAARMGLAIALSRENVLAGSGGPFGAAVFDADGRRPLAIGVNLVEAAGNACLHAEIVALMFAQAAVRSWTLRRAAAAPRVLYTSCTPCAMCLGAVLWSGVGRLVCGATREDALALGFDEGPVFAESWRYLETRGVAIELGVLAAEAREVFTLYKARGGLVYNA